MLKTCVEATPLHEKRLRKAKRKYLEEALLVLFKQQRLSAAWAGFSDRESPTIGGKCDDIDGEYLDTDGNLIMSEILIDEYIVNEVVARNEVEPEDNTHEDEENDFGAPPPIRKGFVFKKTL
ncbi:unnamed protein product [Hermetia illucens]|uniref:Uncharacterized protein n=1 Tax=Hermetia illucens TaxID=343691 RepID=A0A7R8Z0J9_HERIL|nr:unnamed protein product [Hermetia illucens]